jgi:hypothetical protein
MTTTPVDPMKGFRGLMAAFLALEAIVVALSLLVVAKLDGGLATGAGVVVGIVVVLLVVLCFSTRRPWAVSLTWLAQVALVGCVLSAPEVAIVGVIFAAIWGYLSWLRRDVARRMAAGQLPGQQAAREPGA